MTADRDRLRALADAATPGPWRQPDDEDSIRGAWSDAAERWVVQQYDGEPTTDDAAFIAAADPDTIRQLLDTLDQVEDEANAIRAELGTLLRLAEERQRVAEAKVARVEALADEWDGDQPRRAPFRGIDGRTGTIAPYPTEEQRLKAKHAADLRAALDADKDTP